MLMTADEVKRRLGEGEDAILLSLEHWLQVAQHLKQYGKIPYSAYGAEVCPFCLAHDNCRDCPLYQLEGKHCCEPGECYDVFERTPTYENALGVVAALAKCKSPEPKVPQFYIWRQGEEPQGKVGLRLVKGDGDTIVLQASNINDRDGWWHLLGIHQNGRPYLVGCVGKRTGLDLDSSHRLRLQQE